MRMMKIDLDKSILDLSGNPIDGGQIYIVLANLIANGSSIEPAKWMSWAMSAYNNKFIEIDEFDLKKIVDFVSTNTNISNIAKKSILEALNG
jgi:hypothetical protein